MKGHRVMGTISGVVFGLGLVVLLQEFAVVPLTTIVLVLVPVGTALVGLAMGWPRPTTGGAAASASGGAVQA